MKVLVTGGTGFTGSKLAKKLFFSGVQVRLLVRDKSKVQFSDGFEPELIEGDIRDKNSVDMAVKGVEKVFNIAAVFRTAGIPDQAYWDIHVKGTENLLKASLRYDVERFIHCSTMGVHGHVEQGPVNEEYRFSPGDIYQVTKLEGELKALAFGRESGLPVAIIRPCAIYGPGDMRLYKLFKLASKKVIPILGSGKIFYHMIYIDDLVDAFLLASKKEQAIGESFLIGSDEVLSLLELINRLSALLDNKPVKLFLPVKPFQNIGTLCERLCIPLGIEPPIYRRRVDFFTKSRFFDINKAKTLLGFSPKISIDEGLTRTANWYQRQGLL